MDTHITVKELIAILSHFDGNDPVLIGDSTTRICTDIIGLNPEVPFPMLLIEHGSFDLDPKLLPANDEHIH